VTSAPAEALIARSRNRIALISRATVRDGYVRRALSLASRTASPMSDAASTHAPPPIDHSTRRIAPTNLPMGHVGCARNKRGLAVEHRIADQPGSVPPPGRHYGQRIPRRSVALSSVPGMRAARAIATRWAAPARHQQARAARKRTPAGCGTWAHFATPRNFHQVVSLIPLVWTLGG
jgi:hypothetical protein